MKKSLLILLGVIVLVVAYWLISPLFITTVSTETMADLSMDSGDPVLIRRGQFSDGDPGHHASGEAVLLELADGTHAIRFEDDFEITNGPDLYVYLGNDGTYDKTTILGKLKGSMGGQNYIVPAGINVGDYNEVWVWCRAFGVKFGSAMFGPVGI